MGHENHNTPACKYAEIDIFEFFESDFGNFKGTSQSDIIFKEDDGPPSLLSDTIATWKYAVAAFTESPNVCGPSLGKGGFVYPKVANTCSPQLNTTAGLDLSKDFFVYGVDWRPDSVIFYLNNTRIMGVANTLHIPMHIELGSLSLSSFVTNSPTTYPTDFQVDYLRIYKRNVDIDLMLERFPSVICEPSTASYPFADITQATCQLTDVFPFANTTTTVKFNVDITDMGNFPIPTSTMGAGYNINDYGANAWLYLNQTPTAGNYKIKYTLFTPSGNPITATKTFTISTQVPPQPSVISVQAMDGCFCTASVNPISSAQSYIWKKNNITLNGKTNNTVDYLPGGTYALNVSAKNTCGVSSPRIQTKTCTPDANTCRLAQQDSVPEEIRYLLAQNYSLFPNPATDVLSVSLPDNEDGAEIAVYSLEGKLLHLMFTKDKMSDILLDNFVQGVYICVIKINATTYRDKFMVAK